MHPNTTLYEQDFFAWTQTTAAMLRAGKWHEVDSKAIAEELESMGRSQKRELDSCLEVLVMHLLKWRYQPGRREDSHSWYDTILEQRGQIARLLADNPSLHPHVPALLTAGYLHARRRAVGETHLGTAVFPEVCPWTVVQLLDMDFWPDA